MEFLENFILFFLFLVALTSLFFLPNNSIVILVKQYFVLGFAFLLLIFWSAWILFNKKFEFVGDKWTYLVPFFFIAGSFISAVFSKFRYGSFWGTQAWSESFFSLAALAIIFFVSINYLNKRKFLKFFNVFIGSIAIVEILYILFASKVLKISWLPINLIGQNVSLAFIAALSLVFCVAFFIYLIRNEKDKYLNKSLLIALTILNLVILSITNYRPAWVVLIIGLAAFVIFDFIRHKKRKINFYFLPAVIIIIAIAFTAIGQLKSLPQAETETLPNARLSYKIAEQSFWEDPIKGIGINNYNLAYNLYRPGEVNQTRFWSETFYYAYSKIFSFWTTGGLIVLIPYLVFLIYFSIRAAQLAADKRQHELLFGLSSVWIAYAAGSLVFISNLTVDLFAFFALAGIIVYSWKKKRRKRKKNLVKLYSVMIIFIILLLLATIGLFFSMKRFAAGQMFFQVSKYAFVYNMQPQVEKWLDLASKWDSQNDLYHRALANFYIKSINNLKNQQPSQNKQAEYQTYLQGFIVKAEKASKNAIAANSMNYLNYINQADFYNATYGMAANSLEWTEKSLSKALEFFPKNVIIINRLAKVQYNRAMELKAIKNNLDRQNKDTEEIETKKLEYLYRAKKNASKAIELRSNYWPVHYTLALVEWELENSEKAIEIMENLQKVSPKDVGVKFYLALMYDQKNQTDKAIELLEQAVSLAPTFSDGLWVLAGLYQRRGEIEQAEKTLEKILNYDPQNENVLKSLENLKQAEISAPKNISDTKINNDFEDLPRD